MIVWDWGTWTPVAKADDPAPAVEQRRTALRPRTARSSRGRFVLVRRGAEGRPRAVAAAAQARRGGGRGLGPRGPSAVGEVGPHQRRGAGQRRRTRGRATRRPWRRGRATRVRPGHRRRARGARRAARRKATWNVGGVDVRLTNLDKVLFPGEVRGQAADQARPHPLPRRDRAGDAPVPRGPARQPAPLPRRRRASRASGTRRCPTTRPTGCTRFHYDDAGEGETEWYAVVDTRAGAGVDGELRRRSN